MGIILIGKMPDGLISCPPRPQEMPIVRQGSRLQANQKQPSLGGEWDPRIGPYDSVQ